MKSVNWAMIGCGDVTETKSGPGLYKSEDSNLTGVYSRTYEKAVAYAKRHWINKVYKSVEELFADSEVDIVYIATPPASHYKYAMMCLQAGKIPYIEKPVANSYQECLEIKALAEEKGIPVYAAFYRRGMDKFLKIKEMLADKIIGEVRYVRVTQLMPVAETELDRENLPWRLIPEISGGGKFLDMGVHVLDYLAMFFGEYEYMRGIVCNQGGYYEAEDTVMASFKFKSGVVGSGDWCFVGDKEVNEVQIIGEKGRIVFDGLAGDEFTFEVEGRVQTYYFQVHEHIAMPYEQAVVNELIGKEKSQADFAQAVNVVQMTDMLLQDYRKRIGVK